MKMRMVKSTGISRKVLKELEQKDQRGRPPKQGLDARMRRILKEMTPEERAKLLKGLESKND